MFLELQHEAQIKKNALAIEALAIKIDDLNRDIEGFLKELNVSSEQLTTYLNDKDNFSPENWSTIVEQRKALDEKLMRELLNIANPKKTKQVYADRNIQSHWLFVR